MSLFYINNTFFYVDTLVLALYNDYINYNLIFKGANKMKQLKVIIMGAGSRGSGYAKIMAKSPERYKVVGVAEPIESRRNFIKNLFDVEDSNCYDTWEKILDVPKFADIAVVSMMDQMHTEPALKALELGYDLLLEKPAAPTPEECGLIYRKAKECGRKIIVCHVLRYTPHFLKMKSLIDDGTLGDIVSIEHTEAVGNVHQSHSFVRGNWGNEGRSSFMLLQKCCHDIDILQWLVGKKCSKIQSFGSLNYFCEKNAPEGSPERCHEGCPVGDTCPYNAVKLYYDAKTNSWFRGAATKLVDPTDEDVMHALETTQYGKCVFKCDNDVVDHQTVNMLFDDNSTISMTMCAFTKGGRTTHIMGTKGELWADTSSRAAHPFTLYNFETKETTYPEANITVSGDSIVTGHGGGDGGIINALYSYIVGEIPAEEVSEIEISCKNHLLVFAAEDSRKQGVVIDIDDYYDKYMK